MSKNRPIKKISYIFLPLICLLFIACQAGSSNFISNQKSAAQQENKSAVDSTQTANAPTGQHLPVSAQAIINQQTVIELEVAQTPEQQAKGLMFREALPDNRGMLFLFTEARLSSFWMYQVPVALDMVFLKQVEESGQTQNSTRKVVEITDSAPPCKVEPKECPLYGPDTFVDGVIELRAGRAKELGLTKGNLIEIKFLDSAK